MRVPRIYINQALALNEQSELPDAAAHYVRTVLRLEIGRELVVFNGEGGEYLSSIIALDKKRVAFETRAFDATNNESPLISELAIGISRGDRMDWIIQKATELGVTRIVPLFTERTEVKLKADRLDKKLQHWTQVMVSACEQCQRNRLVEIATPTTLSDYLADSKAQLKLILHPSAQNFTPSQHASVESVTLLVGPEGGFSEAEVAAAMAKEFQGWILGPRILRTETAPLAALAIAQQYWGDWRGV